jgi:hypothetical protein
MSCDAHFSQKLENIDVKAQSTTTCDHLMFSPIKINFSHPQATIFSLTVGSNIIWTNQ